MKTDIEEVARDIVDAAFKVRKEFGPGLCRLGFLINWNVKLIKNGIVRVANGITEPSRPARKP